MKYAAFIRGVGPENPNTRHGRLKALFEGLGFTGVQPFISSGNVIFSTSSRSAAALERKIEKALKSELSFEKEVFVRSQKELGALQKKDPFKGATHGRNTYLLVTFMKRDPREVFVTIDLTKTKGPEFMAGIEKKYGTSVTSRTWKTVERIVAKMGQD